MAKWIRAMGLLAAASTLAALGLGCASDHRPPPDVADHSADAPANGKPYALTPDPGLRVTEPDYSDTWRSRANSGNDPQNAPAPGK